MTQASCPACGVAVVPGYVRCPKCHRPLPRFARNSISPVGGTSLDTGTPKGSPVLAILVAVAVGGGIIAYFALRGGGKKAAATETAEQQTENPNDQGTTQPGPNPVQQTTQNPTAPVVHPEALASELERSLKKQRLWATVSVIGDRVDVRSGSCGDAAMKPALEAVAASFKAAGITRLRCLEQSGSLVFDL